MSGLTYSPPPPSFSFTLLWGFDDGIQLGKLVMLLGLENVDVNLKSLVLPLTIPSDEDGTGSLWKLLSWRTPWITMCLSLPLQVRDRRFILDSRSGHDLTSTASARSHQWHCNRERQISVGTAGPQPRVPDLSGELMSEQMPNRVPDSIPERMSE